MTTNEQAAADAEVIIPKKKIKKLMADAVRPVKRRGGWPE